jgi:hypothetical protein
MGETKRGSKIIDEMDGDFASKPKRKDKKKELGLIERAFSNDNGNGKREAPPSRR